MADAQLLVGLDVGSTSIKAVVYRPDGTAIARGSVPTPTHYPKPGWAYFLAEELWDGCVTALRQALAEVDDPRAVVGVAVASIGESVVPIAADGTPTGEVVSWFDTRTRPQATWLDDVVGKDEIFRRTGLSRQPIFSLCKILWFKQERPEEFARTVKWLMVADYIAWRLSGEAVTDLSLASRSLAMNLHAFDWDRDMLAAAGISPDVLAPLASGGTRIGTVSADASRITGLPTTCAVSTGGHDHVCGAFAAGVVEPGQLLNSLGTAEAVFLAADAPLTDPEAGRQGYTQGAHVVGKRRYVLAGLYTSGACVTWVRDLLTAAGGEPPTYDALFAQAAAAPAGSLGTCFLPHLRLANPPYDDPKSRGTFVGLSWDVNQGALVRSVLEGIAFEGRRSLESLVAFSGVVPPTSCVAIGGGTRNSLLMDIKATVMGIPVTVADAEEATALGAALLAGLGAGVYANVDAALSAMTYPRHDVAAVPEWSSIYERIYRDVYTAIYDRVAPLSHALVDIVSGEPA